VGADARGDQDDVMKLLQKTKRQNIEVTPLRAVLRAGHCHGQGKARCGKAARANVRCCK
jgi:hypothetical protein